MQVALDKLMDSHERTTIVIAHRLSTVRKADRIVFIAGGKVRESGSHADLVDKPNGRYNRLVESQKRKSTVNLNAIKKDNQLGEEDEEEDIDFEKEAEELASKAFNKAEARRFATPEIKFYIVGAVGCALAGGVFPAWGIVFAEMIGLLFYPVVPCFEGNIPPEFALMQNIPESYQTCDDYYKQAANSIQELSFEVSLYWVGIIAACLVGNLLAFWGLGYATERINRRMRDMTFSSLMRQEVAFFDKRSVGSITSQLQDDVSFVFAFSGEPIRTLVINLSSVVTGLTISMVSFERDKCFCCCIMYYTI